MRRLRYKWYPYIRHKAAIYGFLSVLTAVFCYLFCFRYGIFGAKVDWISQHSVFPDYFRQQFYETGELFPEFAANIGGGQNIYNFAYYGLYNPVLLPSYLLPFVKMSDYMMAVQFLSLTASVILMHGWLKKRGFPEGICIGATMLFVLAGPVIFHSYNQIMFVNYMPFLLMGLMGADRYFEEKKSCAMLCVSIFLMIMTSFYFSIGGMLVLVLYGICRYLAVYDGRGEKMTLKAFAGDGARFAVPFVLAVMMSGVLLAPAASALTGREGKEAVISLKELLVPRLSASGFCYSAYGTGLTTLALTALLALLFGKKLYERALAWSVLAVLTVPLCAYLMNGGLYVRDKVMIPFLPLLCYIVAYYLEYHEKAGIKGVLPYVLTMVLLYVCKRQGEAGKYWKLLILDAALSLACFVILRFIKIPEAKRNGFMLLAAVMLLLVSDNAYGIRENRPVKKEFYEDVTDEDIKTLIEEVTGEEEGFYRTEQLGGDVENAANLNRVWGMEQYLSSVYSSSCHEGYRKFREETFQLEEPFRNFLMQSAARNPVYQRFMGIKYVVSEEAVPGYELLKSKGKWKAYENNRVSPAAYATDRVMTEEMYEKLEFPYNQLALLAYAVTEDSLAEGAVNDYSDTGRKRADRKESIMETVKPVDLKLPDMIESDKNETLETELPDLMEGKEGEKVLFLRFRIENLKPRQDAAVWVEGVRNKLTARNHFYYNANTEFTYAVLLEDGQKSVEIVFGKGKYKITDVKSFTGILPDREDNKEGGAEEQLYQSAFQMEHEKTKGNCIEGTIDVKRTGYFVTTIPYDENFEILADGETVKGEKVNTAFLGFKIEEGEHEIRIIYHAPGVKAGKAVSAAGLLLFLFTVWPAARKPFLLLS